MFDAVCKHSDAPTKMVSIVAFQRLVASDIEAFRQHLFCPGCGGKAYYRKASIDGRAACFGSRYHDDDCKEFHPSLAKERAQLDAEEINQIVLEADALMIDFNPTHTIKSNAKAQTEPQLDDTSKTETSSEAVSENRAPLKPASNKSNSPQNKLTSRGLDKLLNSLLRGSELDKSDLWIYTDEKYRWRAKNLFVNFADATPTDNGSPRMYWGTLSHADKTMNWLNPADCKDVGIPIESIRETLFKRFSILEPRDLEGAGMIVFGQCFWNKDKSRKIIKIWGKDSPRIFLIKAEDS